MKLKKRSGISILLLQLALMGLLFTGCDRLSGFFGTDKLYFCESYDSATNSCNGSSAKYKVGVVTIIVKLKQNVGVPKVNINVTDKATEKVVNTVMYNVQSDESYIYFKDVEFTKPGMYRVSMLKEDGTLVVTNDIEITEDPAPAGS